MVWLHGPPGVGKSRLAAEFLVRREPTEHVVAHLTGARDTETVLARLASALKVPLSDVDEPDALIERLRHALEQLGECFVVLNDIEPIEQDWFAPVERLADQVESARFIVTCRARPSGWQRASMFIEPLSLQEAGKLFAQTYRPSTQVDFSDDEWDVVNKLVDRLDRIPLAIELAAARGTALGPRDLLDRLDDRFDLLQGTDSSRSLQEAVEWSWQLLDEGCREVLAQCAVFEGDFALEAAEEIVELQPACDHDLLNVLEELYRRSLVYTRRYPAHAGRARFALYRLIRDYVRPRSERPEAARRHAEYFAGLDQHLSWGELIQEDFNTLSLEVAQLQAVVDRYKDAEPQLALRAGLVLEQIHRQAAATERHQAVLQRVYRLTESIDQPQLAGRAYLQIAAAHRTLGDAATCAEVLDVGTRLVADCEPDLAAMLWAGRADIARTQGYHQQARDDLAHAQQLVDAHRLSAFVRASVLDVAGAIAAGRGAGQEAADAFLETARLYRLAGRADKEAWQMVRYAAAQWTQGRLQIACKHIEDSVERMREIGLQTRIARALNDLAGLNITLGDYGAAHAHIADSLELTRGFGQRTIHHRARCLLGRLFLAEGQLDEARTELEAALEALTRLNDGYFRQSTVKHLAAVHQELGQWNRAAAYLEQWKTDPKDRYMRISFELSNARLLLELDQWREAVDRLDKAVEMGSDTDMSLMMALVRLLRAVGWFKLGEADRAEADVDKAGRLLGAVTPCMTHLVVDLFDLYLKRRRSGTPASVHTLLAEVDPPAGLAGCGHEVARGSFTLRLLLRLLDTTTTDETDEPPRADDLATLPPVGADDLVAEADAAWFRLGDGETVDLSRRKAIRRIFARLVDRRQADADRGLSVEQLAEVGWPDEVLLESAAANRVYVAIGTLRKMGLEGVLLRQSSGYLLDPNRPLHIREDDS